MSDGPIIRQRFHTLEEMTAKVRRWDLDFKQLTADRSGSELSQFRLGGLLLTHAVTGCRHAQQGASPPGAYTFAVLADDAQTVYWCGHRLDNSLLAFFAAGQDFEAAVHPRFSVFTLTMDPVWLEAEPVWRSLHETMTRRGSHTRWVLASEDSDMARLRGLVKAAVRLASSHLFLRADTSAQSELGTDIIEALIAAVGSANLARESVTAAARARMLRRVLDYIGDRLEAPIRVSELCRLAQASERTLQRAFLERFDVTPKAYLQALRLNGVRRDLLASEPSAERIQDVAMRWGFWHMGQLAADYRRLFFELPSQTLARPLPAARNGRH